ncbi:MAG: polymerase sigma factor SigE [Planctomycetota bacterium]|jgi:RNA polymerase sigma factor (sigma-70 family)
MTPNPSDRRLEQLIQNAQQGDKDAWNRLAAQILPWLQNTAERMTRDHHLAEDAVWEVLIEVGNALPVFQWVDEPRWKAWLRRILRHKVLWLLKKQRRCPGPLPIYGSSDDGTVVSLEPADTRRLTPEQEAERNEVIEQVRRCVGRLPPLQREAILSYQDLKEKYSAEEVAGQQGINLHTFKSRVEAARRSLKECLAREGLAPRN